MANILILGGGFGGLIAAEKLARFEGSNHHVTLISRDSNFVFYPDLVRLAFDKCREADVSFDLRETLVEKGIRFIEGEVARVRPESNEVVLAGGEIVGSIHYDYLILALGRRLATERVTGFFEYANHLLTVDAAKKFGEAIRHFSGGRAIIGQCDGARLPTPVYETAFALSRYLREKEIDSQSFITIVSSEQPSYQLGDARIARALRNALDEHNIEYLPDFVISSISPGAIISATGQSVNYRLLMLVPPFTAASASLGTNMLDADGYIKVDPFMRVVNHDRTFAVGDCVSLPGPKLAHMAVHQAEVAAANLILELSGRQSSVTYEHELMMVIDEGGPYSTYVEQDLDSTDQAVVSQGRFWSWAKLIHDRYWQAKHS